MTSSLPPREDLSEYFDELTNLAYAETLQKFFTLDAQWTLLREPAQAGDYLCHKVYGVMKQQNFHHLKVIIAS